jgi:hypothetical protein
MFWKAHKLIMLIYTRISYLMLHEQCSLPKAPEKKKEDRKRKKKTQSPGPRRTDPAVLCSHEHIPPFVKLVSVCSRSIDRDTVASIFALVIVQLLVVLELLARTTYALHSAQWRIFLQPFARGGVCRAQREFDALVGDS